ncbi:hypothetical protein Q8A67_021261 [Cirrhinus molitorella]|uniref:Uncharacterized protein n=1 Tax=Cirrhinus molitorella TaxID=172907 RepID=A0AA88TML7_9TELE|nr:hypothetical protein Q8A67_021261 [Cirrhinus molitorella]
MSTGRTRGAANGAGGMRRRRMQPMAVFHGSSGGEQNDCVRFTLTESGDGSLASTLGGARPQWHDQGMESGSVMREEE